MQGDENLSADVNTIAHTHGAGINVSGLTDNNSIGNYVLYNIIDNTGSDAIDGTGSAGLDIGHNQIGQNGGGIGRYGVYMTGNSADASGASAAYDNTIDNTTSDAIHAEGNFNLAVIDNHIGTFGGNVGGNGIYSHGDNALIVQNNTIAHTTHAGITVSNLTGTNLIDTNTINNTGADGIDAVSSAGLTISNNYIGTLGLADNIQGTGIFVQNSDGVMITDNYTAHTFSTGDQIGSGIYVENNNGDTISGNHISDSNWDGIKIEGANGISVSDNVIDGTTRVGIWANNVNTGTITGNHVSNHHLAGYGAITGNDGSDLTVTDNTVAHSDGFGIEMYGVSGTNLVDGNHVDFTSSDGINAVSTSGLTISNNFVGENGGGIGGDGIHVESSAGAHITNNQIDPAGNGIYVNASDGANVAGNTVDSFSTGIYVTGSNNATIGGAGALARNTVTGGGTGIYASNDGDLTIENNKVQTTSGVGILVSGLFNINALDTSNIFTNVVDHTGLSGIEADGSTNLVIGAGSLASGNSVTNAGGDGIKVVGGSHDTVAYNTITTVTGASGISVGQNSTNDTVDHNVISNTNLLGVYVGSSDGISVTNNTITNTGLLNNGNFALLSGIDVEHTNGVTVTGNTISTTKGDGINLGDSINYSPSADSNVTVDGNTIHNVARDGIHATAGVVSASNNVIYKTANDGININHSNGAQVNGNKIGINGAGFGQGTNNVHGDGIEVDNSASASISSKHSQGERRRHHRYLGRSQPERHDRQQHP